jgi:hypothetical protein
MEDHDFERDAAEYDAMERDHDEPYDHEDARFDDWYDEQYEAEDF